MTREPCQCEVCRLAQRVDAAIQAHPDLRELLTDIWERLEGVETSEACLRAIVDGTWPDANYAIAQARLHSGVRLPVASDAETPSRSH